MLSSLWLLWAPALLGLSERERGALPVMLGPLASAGPGPVTSQASSASATSSPPGPSSEPQGWVPGWGPELLLCTLMPGKHPGSKLVSPGAAGNSVQLHVCHRRPTNGAERRTRGRRPLAFQAQAGRPSPSRLCTQRGLDAGRPFCTPGLAAHAPGVCSSSSSSEKPLGRASPTENPRAPDRRPGGNQDWTLGK